MANTLLQEFHHNFGGKINVVSLASRWSQLAAQELQGADTFTGRDHQAVALRAAQHLQDMRLKSWGRDAEISQEEWLHATLMLSAPDHFATQIYAPLKASLAKHPGMLYDLQALFQLADTQGRCMLTKQDVVRMYAERLWRLNPSSAQGQSLQDHEFGDPQKMAEQLIRAMDVDGNGLISYAEFVAFCVGRRKRQVRLHLYDLSRGQGPHLKMLLGKGLERIWHTGVVAFDKEYYFSNDTLLDLPGKTGFGEPTEIITLGDTLWSQDELHNFIITDLKPLFHRATYDVINNNCNHFSDRLSMYLLGKHIPEDILLQSSKLMSLVSVWAARPVLNWLLRDCVVSRSSTALSEGRAIEVPHGSWRHIESADELVPGVVVAIHSAWGRSSAVLGVVSESPKHGGDSDFTFPFGLSMLACDGSSYKKSNEVSGSSSAVCDDEVWVKYLETAARPGHSNSCYRAFMRSEKVPLANLSLAMLDGLTVGADYRQAFELLTRKVTGGLGKQSAFVPSDSPITQRNRNNATKPPSVVTYDLTDTNMKPGVMLF
eukprot:TRINITY_DN7651_c0_g1_i2.p1 TRINITY_DN7651_c0_g1~~TRINITY_DN7651_c0_g1_i2.p1  ORF type:complete len:544 (-),score=85.00 TRINITY_DN7651_c0_g1_i2:439-2070(-)